MREATLGGVSALDARPSKATGKPRSPGAGRRGNTLSPRLRRVRAHIALIVGSAGFSAIMIGIILNATVMQKEHHPAPLFGAAAPPVHVAAAPPTAPADTGPGLVPPRPSVPVTLPPLAAASPPMISTAPLPTAAKAAVRVPQTTVALHGPRPPDAIARFLDGAHASSHAAAAAHGPAKPVSTQPRTAALAKPRPAVPVATRSEPALAAAVN